MIRYYDDTLAAERLKTCYGIAPPGVRRYLETEIEHVLGRIRPGDLVLELGCGYGRVMRRLAEKAGFVTGLDTSYASLRLGKEHLRGIDNHSFLCADVVTPVFRAGVFDLVVCVQNGISAFHADPEILARESLRITREGGLVLFSSYSDRSKV